MHAINYRESISLFISVSLVWVHGYSNILGNCRADEVATAGVLLSKSSSIELGIGHRGQICHCVEILSGRQPFLGQLGVLLNRH